MQAILKIVESIEEAVKGMRTELSTNTKYTYTVSKNIRKQAQQVKLLAFDLRKLASEEYKKTKV
jgi:hypothetical protein